MKSNFSGLAGSGWVDSASLYQVIDYFDQAGSAPLGYPWSRQTVVDLTTLFLLTEYQQLAPAPQAVAIQENLQSFLLRRLHDSRVVNTLAPLDPWIRPTAKRHAAGWLSQPDGRRQLASSTRNILADRESYRAWIDWVVRSGALVTHVRTHGSLIDTETAELVGLALQKSPSELHDLMARSSNLALVSNYTNGDQSLEFDDLCSGYIASALIRGLAHMNMARSCNVQLTPHPFREQLVPVGGLDASTRPVLRVSNTCEALAKVIIRVAAGEGSTAGRLNLWVENISRSRAILKDAWGYLVEQESAESIERSIHDFSKRAQFQFAKADLSTGTDWAISVFTGLLVAVYVDSPLSPIIGPVAGAVVGGAVGTVLNSLRVSQKVANKVSYLTSDALQSCGSGIVRRNWSPDGAHVQLPTDS